MSEDWLVVAAAQLGPSLETTKHNLDRILWLMNRSAESRVDIICFPEMALSPYFCLEQDVPTTWFHQLDSSTILRIQEQAAQLGMAAVIPFAEVSDSGRFNSAVLIDEQGTVAGRYRKVHIPVAERRYFRSGNSLIRRTLKEWSAGVVICADRSYSEAWRVLGVKGAEVVFAPYNSSSDSARIGLGCPAEADRLAWTRESNEVRMRAAAHMNGFYVVAPGKAGVENGRRYIGDSLIISPWGNVLARAVSDDDELVIARLARADVTTFRATGHYERRNPAAYASLTATEATSYGRLEIRRQ